MRRSLWTRHIDWSTIRSGRPIPTSVIDELVADDDALGTIGTYAIRVADWTYVGKTEVGFDRRFRQHKEQPGTNRKYRILKETGLFDYAHFVPLTRMNEAYEETTGKRVSTDSSLVAIFEIFDIASFDTTDAKRGFNQNLVDDTFYRKILLSRDVETLLNYYLERLEAGVQAPRMKDLDGWAVFLRPIMPDTTLEDVAVSSLAVITYEPKQWPCIRQKLDFDNRRERLVRLVKPLYARGSAPSSRSRKAQESSEKKSPTRHSGPIKQLKSVQGSSVATRPISETSDVQLERTRRDRALEIAKGKKKLKFAHRKSLPRA
ncbi:hypothetical protein HD553DRAFT_155323 [Filobasidium floriforme]|uniref:uncharacterized protein n=1 Tax=Filobasidium floriforme TaxID=5210 RepID=UPI001E8EB69D|nr:uncharacterized protein HD553DRAFT_155323 [Filobasidium floriforme]KAH8089108.1 hypothetical protein HD553DRAFT_155323 [Filobasidium floriforme]